MRVPTACSHIETALAEGLPHVRPAQRLGLALWVSGAVLATSTCQSAVVTHVAALGFAPAALRQRLREWLDAGPERAAPCATTLEVERCLAPVLGWVRRFWRGPPLPLALDVTTLDKRVAVLTVAVLYRGGALPVAWRVRPLTQPGAWMPACCQLLARLAPVVPPDLTVRVLTDRGVWSPRRWKTSRALGVHPLMRLSPRATFAPLGQPRRAAPTRGPGPGHAWVGDGTAFKHRDVRRRLTLVVTWEAGQAEPGIVATALPPEQVGVRWDGLRSWIEGGFRSAKSFGWQGERTRRTDPDRIARHTLVLAVAPRWVEAYGPRAEDAERVGWAPAHLPQPPPPLRVAPARTVSLCTRGLAQRPVQLLRGRRLWQRLWLVPDPLPEPPPGLQSTRVLTPFPEAYP